MSLTIKINNKNGVQKTVDAAQFFHALNKSSNATNKTLSIEGDQFDLDTVEFFGTHGVVYNVLGNIDATANPNYPAALLGDVYRISPAPAGSRIGGVAGKLVNDGDLIIAFAANAGGTQAAVGASWQVDQSYSTGVNISTTIADLQALAAAGNIQPKTTYAITDVAIGGLVNPVYYVEGGVDGSSIAPSGYVQLIGGGVKYPASYDLTNNFFLSVYDTEFNCRISRTLAGGKNCVDNWKLGNNKFQNVGGHEFNLTLAGANASILNASIAPGSFVSLLDGSTLESVQIGEAAEVSIANNGNAQQCIFYPYSVTTLIGGSSLYAIVSGASTVLNADSGANLSDSRFGPDCTVNLNGGNHDGLAVEDDCQIIAINRGTLSSSSFGCGCSVIVTGPAGAGIASRVSGCTFGTNAVIHVGLTTDANSYLLTSRIGDSAVVTLTQGTHFTNCEVGNGKTIICDDGLAYTDSRYVAGFSNFRKAINVTSGNKLRVYYNTLVGAITLGDVCTDTITGAAGHVLAAGGASVVIDRDPLAPDYVAGFFTNTDALTFVGGAGATAVINNQSVTADHAVVVPYNTLAGGAFAYGQVLTLKTGGGNVVLTGTIVSDDGANLVLQNVNIANTRIGANLVISEDPSLTLGYLMTVGGAITTAIAGNITYTEVTIAAHDSFIGIWDFSSAQFGEAIWKVTGLPQDHDVTIADSINQQTFFFFIQFNMNLLTIRSLLQYGAVIDGDYDDNVKVAAAPYGYRQVGLANNYH